MEQQVRELVAQVQVLTRAAEQQGLELRAAEASRAISLQQIQAQVIAQATAASSRASQSRMTFVDVKGIGKPTTLSSELRQFGSWSFKLGNFLEGILGGMKEALEWAQDQDSVILDPTPLGTHLQQGTDVKDAGRQLYAVLTQLCDGEALDLIQNVTGSNG